MATKFWRPAFTAFIIERIQLEEMGCNISVDDKRHTKTNYMKKTGDMDLQKEKPWLTTEFRTDALLSIMPERYNQILDALETRYHKCGIGRLLFSAFRSARR